MSHRKNDRRRVAWTALASVLALGALGIAAGRSAGAANFEVGDANIQVDTTVSAGVGIRVEERNCKLIFVGNSGCNPNPAFSNADDGNLNFGKGRVYSNLYKATVDVVADWKNYGAFFRGSVFYDLVNQEINPERTPLAREARYRESAIESGVVGMGYRLLDAYGYGDWAPGGHPVHVRIGNQVINWGESVFFQGGINSNLIFEVSKLRSPGAEVKEGFLPAPAVRVSAELFQRDGIGNLSVEGYYQFYWFQTQLDPVGSYFSFSDLTGRGAQGFFVGPDPGSQDKTPEEVFESTFPAMPPQVTRPPTGEQALDDLIANIRFFRPDLDPRIVTPLPAFFPQGIPLLGDREPRKQGQWGAALRFFSEPIRTEFGLYYSRFHAKTPQVGFVAATRNLQLQPMYVDFPDSIFGIPLPLPPLPAVAAGFPVPVGYFREFVEDIDLFGASFNTEVWDISFAGEVSYQPRSPVPITTAFTDAIDRTLASGRVEEVSGFVREKRIQASLAAIMTWGPGDPYVGALVRLLQPSTMAVTAEVAVVNYPGLDSDISYAGPGFTTDVDRTSFGYVMRVQGDYDNPWGVPITITPRVSFSHDIVGNTPGLTPFIHQRKSFSVGVQVDYLQVWQFDLAYTNNFGAGTQNLLADRDFVTLSLTRGF